MISCSCCDVKGGPLPSLVGTAVVFSREFVNYSDSKLIMSIFPLLLRIYEYFITLVLCIITRTTLAGGHIYFRSIKKEKELCLEEYL